MARKLIIPLLSIVLAALSLVLIQSIAPEIVTQHFLHYLAGFAIFFIVSRLSFQQLLNYRMLLFSGLVLFLCLTLLIAPSIKGSRRWLELPGFTLQVSQLAIPIVLLSISTFIQKKKMKTKKLIILLTFIALPALLIFLQPDLGSTIIYTAVVSSFFLFQKISKEQFVFFIVAGLVFSLIAWLILLKPYQKQRLLSFFDQSGQADNYNAEQALIAVGSGRFWGRGLGEGVQSQLQFLPENKTDFVFAAFSEETGFVGTTALLSIYYLLIISLLRIAGASSNTSEEFFVLATALFLTLQIFINVGMNMGLMPITGITLPLFSHGGSSTVAILFQLGIVQSIARAQKRRPLRYLA